MNLANDPFILTDGGELSLLELFEQAHNLEFVLGITPIYRMAMLRFLGCLTQRVYGNTLSNLEGKKKLLQKGKFEVKLLEFYLKKYPLELFGSRPFWQIPLSLLTELPAVSVKRLCPEIPSGSNFTRMGGHSDDQPLTLSYGAATRALITHQITCISSGRSKWAHTKNAPFASRALIWLRGDNLFESLVMNTVCEDLGPCSWELPLPSLGQIQMGDVLHVKGWCHALTWHSRVVGLIPGGGGVTQMHYAGSVNPETEEGQLYIQEPFSSSIEAKKDGKVYLSPIGYKEETSLVSRLETLLEGPYTAKHVIEAREMKFDGEVVFLGQAANQADMLFQHEEAFRFNDWPRLGLFRAALSKAIYAYNKAELSETSPFAPYCSISEKIFYAQMSKMADTYSFVHIIETLTTLVPSPAGMSHFRNTFDKHYVQPEISHVAP